MFDPAWGILGIAVLQLLVSLPTFVREIRHMIADAAVRPRRPSRRLVWFMAAVVVFSWLAAGFDVFGKRILSEDQYVASYLTPNRVNSFKLGAGSIITASGNFAPTKIETIAEPGSEGLAENLRDMFIISGLPVQDAAPGRPIGVPKSNRLARGITIVAPVPSVAAETVRVGLERIGMATARATDRSRNDDYLIVEIGRAP